MEVGASVQIPMGDSVKEVKRHLQMLITAIAFIKGLLTASLFFTVMSTIIAMIFSTIKTIREKNALLVSLMTSL